MECRNVEFDEYLKIVTEFHGFAAPGVMAGLGIVRLAKEVLPEEGFFDVICETKTCLPDAIQILTPCSIGNGWLKIADQGRFACIFYNKHTGEGVRIFMDQSKLEKWSEIKTWFMKLKPKKMQDTDLLLAQIRDSGTELYTVQKVMVGSEHLVKSKGGKTQICPSCGEAYPVAHGNICRGCSERMPYEIIRD